MNVFSNTQWHHPNLKQTLETVAKSLAEFAFKGGCSDMKARFKTVDEYIKTFPADIQSILENVRQIIREAAPGAVEVISYQMPAFKLNGVLVWFAAHQNHIGFYPTASVIEAFKSELVPYKSSKGAVQFPLNKPIPFDLVRRIVIFRVKENSKRRG